MSYHPEFDRLVATEPGPDGQEAQPPEALTPAPVAPVVPVEPAPQYMAPQYAPAAPVVPVEPAPQYMAPQYAPAAPPFYAEVPASARKKRSFGWVLPVVIALIGLIASGSLGYLLYTTTNEREAALKQGAATQATLDKLQAQFDAQQADAASRKVVADYVFMVERNNARVHLDYHAMGTCKSFGACRIAAQNFYNDLQAWQSERGLAKTSTSLVAANNMLGDALSAAIAGARQFISGMDALNVNTVIAAGKKIDAALFSIDKAESAIGSVSQQNP